MCLALVLDADGVELVVVDVVLTGGAVHVALLQLYPEPVPGRLDVLSHVGTPAGKVDALEAGVQSGCTPEVSRQCAINFAIVSKILRSRTCDSDGSNKLQLSFCEPST